MWKWMLAFFVTSVAACAAGGYFLAQNKDVVEFIQSLRPADKPLEVRIAKPELGTLTRTVNSPGSIEPKTKVQISAQVSARITSLPVRAGDTVKLGEVVVRLDSRDLAAALESAQASERSEQARLEGARASLARAQLELARQRDLATTGDAARTVLESAESDFLRAKSQVDASTHAIEIARANIIRARKDLENCEITAPFDGVVTVRNVEEGELVLVGTMNNAASVIMEIADLDTMLMKAKVDEANIAPIKEGQVARVFVNAHRGKVFEGTVDRVGLKREADRDGTGYYEVEILLKKPEGLVLYSGLTANTDIEVESFFDVLKLPSQAIVDRKVDELPAGLSDNPYVDRTRTFARVVYAVEEGKAKAVPVSVGSSDLTHTIILGGLAPDTPVIVGPFKVLVDLQDDRKVAEESKKPAAAAILASTDDAATRGKQGEAGATPARSDAKQPADTKSTAGSTAGTPAASPPK